MLWESYRIILPTSTMNTKGNATIFGHWHKHLHGNKWMEVVKKDQRKLALTMTHLTMAARWWGDVMRESNLTEMIIMRFGSAKTGWSRNERNILSGRI